MPTSGLCCPGGPQSENQSKRKERQVYGPCLRTEKAMKHDGDASCNKCTRNGPQRSGIGTGRVGNKKTSRNYPDYSNFIDRPEYGEESWRPKQISCPSDSSERPLANAGGKIARNNNNNNNNNNAT